jgi:hypothetical protein
MAAYKGINVSYYTYYLKAEVFIFEETQQHYKFVS